MIHALIASALILSAAPATSDEEVKFAPAAEVFADAAACRTHLQKIVSDARSGDYDVVRGPYPLEAGDVRVHLVRAEGGGHRIWEHRCVDKDLSSRTWNHVMVEADEEFTVESAARKAEWLKKEAPKKEQ